MSKTTLALVLSILSIILLVLFGTFGLKLAMNKYIADNPEEIIESVTRYQQSLVQKQGQKAETHVAENWKAWVKASNDPYVGTKNADVTVIEFFDYSCGYCHKVLPSIMKLIESHKNVRVIFKEFPIFENSDIASKFALAVHHTSPEKYLQVHQSLFTKHLKSKEEALAYATTLGLNAAQIDKAMESQKVQDILVQNRVLASEAGIQGTPAFIINGLLIPGAVDYQTLEKTVKEAAVNN